MLVAEFVGEKSLKLWNDSFFQRCGAVLFSAGRLLLCWP